MITCTRNRKILVNSRFSSSITYGQFDPVSLTLAVDLLKKNKQKLDIFEAASIGDTETTSKLLDNTPDLLNSFSPDGFTVLGLASFFGHLILTH